MTDQEKLLDAFYGYTGAPITKKPIKVKVRKIVDTLPLTIEVPRDVYKWLIAYGGCQFSASASATQIINIAYRAALPSNKEATVDGN